MVSLVQVTFSVFLSPAIIIEDVFCWEQDLMELAVNTDTVTRQIILCYSHLYYLLLDPTLSKP